jgi:hypothetical protein
MPRITTRRISATAALVILAGLILWQIQYGHPGDRKDLRYQAWKLGLCPMDLDQAVSTMVGDIYPDKLVVGKTREELVKKFGYVSSLSQASEYVRYCYYNYPHDERQVLILRKSNWMVLMNNGRAEQLILVKGC